MSLSKSNIGKGALAVACLAFASIVLYAQVTGRRMFFMHRKPLAKGGLTGKKVRPGANRRKPRRNNKFKGGWSSTASSMIASAKHRRF